MKKLVFSAFAMVVSLAAQAVTVNSNNEKILPSSVDQVLRLVDKRDDGSPHKKLSIIVTDRGMSTDVSPSNSVYLGYASNAEMGNISANFKITDYAFKVISATRKEAGVYEVKAMEAEEGSGFVEVTYKIDATKMFVDEKASRNKCGSDFCDLALKTSVNVTRTSKPTTWK